MKWANTTHSAEFLATLTIVLDNNLSQRSLQTIWILITNRAKTWEIPAGSGRALASCCIVYGLEPVIVFRQSLHRLAPSMK